jgi:N-acetylglucosaminyldiphosphoundecaprenol N-acetyl-beta-D-mannosaminyltransferase
MENKDSKLILGQRVDFTTYDKSVKKIIQFATQNQSAYICASNVHMVMESYDNKDFQRIINNADIVTPDGMPLVWTLKLLGIKKAERVYGPKLMTELLKLCSKENIPIGLYGGSQEVINNLLDRLPEKYNGLKIVYAVSPPYRELTKKEINKTIIAMKSSNCKIMFIGLGCPKQENWMAKNSPQLPMPLLGVGAAFDFLSNPKMQAPLPIQRVGLEWLYRLFTEPRRLWYRYCYHNPRFIYRVLQQVIFNSLRKS